MPERSHALHDKDLPQYETIDIDILFAFHKSTYKNNE
jgi:hypothetical protein